jgi:hypothetical protein
MPTAGRVHIESPDDAGLIELADKPISPLHKQKKIGQDWTDHLLMRDIPPLLSRAFRERAFALALTEVVTRLSDRKEPVSVQELPAPPITSGAARALPPRRCASMKFRRQGSTRLGPARTTVTGSKSGARGMLTEMPWIPAAVPRW